MSVTVTDLDVEAHRVAEQFTSTTPAASLAALRLAIEDRRIEQEADWRDHPLGWSGHGCVNPHCAGCTAALDDIRD